LDELRVCAKANQTEKKKREPRRKKQKKKVFFLDNPKQNQTKREFTCKKRQIRVRIDQIGVEEQHGKEKKRK